MESLGPVSITITDMVGEIVYNQSITISKKASFIIELDCVDTRKYEISISNNVNQINAVFFKD